MKWLMFGLIIGFAAGYLACERKWERDEADFYDGHESRMEKWDNARRWEKDVLNV